MPNVSWHLIDECILMCAVTSISDIYHEFVEML